VALEIRSLAEPDLPFLREMLYEALMWRPDAERYPIDFVLAHPEVTRYHEGWGRAGDVGLVAADGTERLGAAWYRLFTEADHGEGYVDAETPELAVAVTEESRGSGLGTRLMNALADEARAAGFARLSLSVDSGNPARRLYERLGYRQISAGDEGVRMVLDLR
jgi:GNAT superfamily N-acetyltransferase